MNLRIHQRVFAGFAGVVGLMAVLVAAFAGSGLRNELEETFRQELTRSLALGAMMLEAAPGADPDSLARALTRRIGYRVTVIAEDGRVLGDSYVAREELPEVENHGQRPEVLAARGGEVGFAVRRSTTVDQELLYAARRVEAAGRTLTLRIAAPFTEVRTAVSRVRQAVLVSGLLAMGLALIIAYMASRVLSRPLVEMAGRARRLAQGAFDERPRVHTGVPELDDLGLALNRLTEELQANLAELRHERDEMQALIDTMAEGVVALTEDARILRTNRAARTLLGLGDVPAFAPVGSVVRHPGLRAALDDAVAGSVDARDVEVDGQHLVVTSRMLEGGGAVVTLLDVSELRRLEQVRRDFVANASHELKTPLTAIRGYAETLLEAEPPPELREGFLTSIRDNALRLERLVDDLLDLSRLESGGWVARSEVVQVAATAREAWRAFEPAARAKGVHFVVEGEARVRADEYGLGQIFRNLLENALRHTDEGGTVTVRVAGASGDPVRVEVADDGEGIPSRALPRIFERFFRADAARDRDAGGTGLGLAIVRHLVQAMGGEVEAESELGRGTTIRFTLPGA